MSRTFVPIDTEKGIPAMKTAPLAAVLTILFLAIAVVIPAAKDKKEPAAVTVEAAVLTEDNWHEFAPQGKEADAIYGDIVLRNQHLVAVIAQPKESRNANMTVKQVGGALIDFTTKEHQSDQLSAFYPGKRNYKYATASISGTAQDESQFQLEVPTSGEFLVTGKSVSVSVHAQATNTKPQVTTHYTLAEGQTWLSVVTDLRNVGSAPLTFELEDDLRIDGGKEDMDKSPNGEGELFVAYDRHWGQAYGVENMFGLTLMNSNARTTTLAHFGKEDRKSSVTLEPGKSLTLTRRLWAARDSLALRSLRDEAAGRSYLPVHITVKDADGQPVSHGVLSFVSGEGKPGFGVPLNSAGVLSSRIPSGQHRVQISLYGRTLHEQPLEFSLSEKSDQNVRLKVPGYRAGKVEAVITDAAGNTIPCKVEFRALDGNPLVFGPETAEFAVKNLRYTPNGKFTQELPVGEYDVLISHGPEFDLVEQKLTITAKQTSKLTAKLIRSVDTAGWVSSDFHSHSSPSGDNTGSQLGRVLNLVAEHIEFAPCTEHNRVDTYQPHIESLGIKNFLATVSGMELTGLPLPLNHQNVFPMKRTPHTQDGGAPLTADNLEDQLERLALWEDRSEKLLQVNHPDLGWMFYDKNGDGQPDGGFERAVPFMDVIEIHPVDSALHLGPVRELPDGRKFHNTIFRWLQLLNQGYRIYGVVNTDAHYNFHGSGWLRNWIQSSTDEPAQIDSMEMVHAAEQGRLVMSNGPFLEVRANEAGQTARVTCGQDLMAKSKQVQLKVRVQCPNWLDVDRVFVLVNGRVSPKHDFSREKTPEVFRPGVVKFEETLELTLEKDAHLVVVAGDVGGSLIKVMGPGTNKIEPAAMTNPIYVDVDGDGFVPNKDLLDHPLPVKFTPGK